MKKGIGKGALFVPGIALAIAGGVALACKLPATVAHPEESVTDDERQTAYRLSIDTLDAFVQQDEEYARQGYGTGRESLEEGFASRSDPSHRIDMGFASYADNEIFVTGAAGVSFDDMAQALSRYGFSVAGYLPGEGVFMARHPEPQELISLWTTCKAMEREPEISSAYPSVSG